MTRIILNIEAGEGMCRECMLCMGDAIHDGGPVVDEEDGGRMRCPACVDGEKRLKDLVESAEEARRWANNRPENWAIQLAEKIDQALAAVKGGKP